MIAHRNTALWIVFLAVLLAAAVAAPAVAQSEGVRLSVSKDWGYSLGNQMQGRFTFSVTGPQDLVDATLVVDGREVATVSTPPFRFPLDTGDYDLGQHTFSATARSADGNTLRSNALTVEFVNSTVAVQSTQRFLVPLIGAILLLIAVGMFGTLFLASRGRKPGTQTTYGAAGAAICPRCGRPFPLSLFNAHVGAGKLVRCPHCGKIALVRRASPEALAAAQATDAAESQPGVPQLSPEELLERQIEESRYS